MKKRFLCVALLFVLTTLTACSEKKAVVDDKSEITPPAKVLTKEEADAILTAAAPKTEHVTEAFEIPATPTPDPDETWEYFPPEKPPVLNNLAERIEFTDNIPSEEDWEEVLFRDVFNLSDTVYLERVVGYKNKEDVGNYLTHYAYVRGSGRVPDIEATIDSYLTFVPTSREDMLYYNRTFTFLPEKTHKDFLPFYYECLFIDEGITELGKFSLAQIHCGSVYFPSTLKKIEKGAFIDTVVTVDSANREMRYMPCYNLDLDKVEVDDWAFGFSGTITCEDNYFGSANSYGPITFIERDN